MPEGHSTKTEPLDPRKFRDPHVTAEGVERAVVALTHLRTLWFNTGSLCNITCLNCYMDSSPTNDRLAYLTLSDVGRYLDEIEDEGLPVEEIAFTGGEPFMNRALPDMIEDSLGRGYRVLVLTNAMKPMLLKRPRLKEISRRYGAALTLRVSVDHFTRTRHEQIRGPGSWAPLIEGLRWLARNSIRLTVAGRTCWGDEESHTRKGYARFFEARTKASWEAPPSRTGHRRSTLPPHGHTKHRTSWRNRFPPRTRNRNRRRWSRAIPRNSPSPRGRPSRGSGRPFPAVGRRRRRRRRCR